MWPRGARAGRALACERTALVGRCVVDAAAAAAAAMCSHLRGRRPAGIVHHRSWKFLVVPLSAYR